MQLEYSSSDEIENQNTKKTKRFKSKGDKKYKARKDTSDSDDEDIQNIRNFSKKKTMNRSKKQKTFSDPLDIVISKKSTLHNDSTINDSTKNRVKSTNFPIVIVEEDEHFSSRQRIDETENVSATQSDNNIRVSIHNQNLTNLKIITSSTSLHSVNHSIDEIEDNTLDEDSRSLQV
ncbi:hypothetical protein F8M41_009206 [Gigaspora margarita]|uniref:Uncharacterized protein n=1 Tax=Gigaspora margarita TaxID=4874 RepID=A0A8H4EQT8_GIGMA|nr:hypothetical protein F8M41_009206 [Gigaspora margarita]